MVAVNHLGTLNVFWDIVGQQICNKHSTRDHFCQRSGARMVGSLELTLARYIAQIGSVVRVTPVCVIDLKDAIVGRTVGVFVSRRGTVWAFPLHETGPFWGWINHIIVGEGTKSFHFISDHLQTKSSTSQLYTLTIRQQFLRNTPAVHRFDQLTLGKRFSLTNGTAHSDGDQNCESKLHCKTLAEELQHKTDLLSDGSSSFYITFLTATILRSCKHNSNSLLTL